MGNIFGSSEREEEQRSANLRQAMQEAIWREEIIRVQIQRQQEAQRQEERRAYENQRRQQEIFQQLAKAVASTKITLIVNLLENPETRIWSMQPYECKNTLCQLVQLSPQDDNYVAVVNKFENTTKNQGFNISKIYRVENPSLYGQYLLKKEELRSRYGTVTERWLFHGTNKTNANKICAYNLNWRCHGTKIGHRFGQGVSFSPIAKYASHYCDKGINKTMLLCFVLVSTECPGEKDMILPPVYDRRSQLRYDTAYRDNEKRDVVVKFSDYEFYPMFQIDFIGKPVSTRRKF